MRMGPHMMLPGDADAVNKLLARHRDALRRMVAMRLDRAIIGRVDASDIVQEALVEAARRLNDYLRQPDMPFLPCLSISHSQLSLR